MIDISQLTEHSVNVNGFNSNPNIHGHAKKVLQISLTYDFGNITLKYHYTLTQIRWFIVHLLIPMKTSLLKG